MRSLATVAMAAAITTFSTIGLAKAAPQPVRRGDLDLSSPIIPPARHKATADERAAIRDRVHLAAIKRARKADRLNALVVKGAMA
jgi:hypothetical protein